MAVLTNPGVTSLVTADAPATLIAAPLLVKIRKLVLVAPAAVAALATVTDGTDRLIAMLAAPAGSSDEIDFQQGNGFTCQGLKVSSMTGAAATLFLYGA
jgi:hypothetical protein